MNKNIIEQIKSVILNANIDIKSKSKDEMLKICYEYKGTIDPVIFKITIEVLTQIYEENNTCKIA